MNFKNSIVALLLMVSCSSFANCDWDEFPTPDDMTTAPLLSQTVHNGQALAAKTFSATLDSLALERFYQRKWGDPIVSEAGMWVQLSDISDSGCMYTVQYQSQTPGTQGRLVMMNLSRKHTQHRIASDLLVPPGAAVASDTVMDDKIKLGRVAVLASELSTSEIASFYKEQLSQSGWELEHSFQEEEARVLVFRDGPALYNVLIVPTPEASQILINEERPK